MYLSRYTIKYVRNKRAFAVVHGTRADSLLLKHWLYWLTECKRLPTCLLHTVVLNVKNLPEIDSPIHTYLWTLTFYDMEGKYGRDFQSQMIRLFDLHFQNFSNCCSQFHVVFFNTIFGGIFATWSNCTTTPRAFEPFSGSQLGFCRPLDLCYLTSFTTTRNMIL